MASQAPNNMLPLLYNGLEPFNRNAHGNYHGSPPQRASIGSPRPTPSR